MTDIWIGFAISGGLAALSWPLTIIFGEWARNFRRFSTRLGFLVGILACNLYLAAIFMSQISPESAEIFVRKTTAEKTGVDYIFPLMFGGIGAIAPLMFVVSLVDWLMNKDEADRATPVLQHGISFFFAEAMILGFLVIATAPAFFVTALWFFEPFDYRSPVTIGRYLHFLEVAIDSATFGLMQSFGLKLYEGPSSQLQLSGGIEYAFSLLVNLVVIKVAVDISVRRFTQLLVAIRAAQAQS